MTWIKLDDGFPTNPKILPLSDSAFRLYIEGLCYSGKYLTDGLLNEVIVKRMGDPAELIEAGIWEEVEGGYQIVNYTEYQTPKAEVERKREQSRERVTRFRKESNAVGNADVTQTEYRIQNTENRITTSSNKFDEFWSVYPRKVGKRDAENAYKRALKVSTHEEIFEGAKRYASDPNRVDQYTAHPATWLNRGSWADQPLPPRTPTNGSRSLVNTPTVVPPRFTAEDAPKGSPIPDFMAELKSRMKSG